MAKVTILAEQSFQASFASGNGYLVQGLPKVDLFVGLTYTVVFDGTEYECPSFSFGSDTVIAIGNSSLADSGEDTGEPFFCYVLSRGTTLVFEDSNEHTVTIYREAKAGEIADDWETIIAKGGNKYPIGSWKFLYIGEFPDPTNRNRVVKCGVVRMCKVAEGEDGSGSTWLALDSLATEMNLNSTETNAGGWEKCGRRTWLNDVLFNALPEVLRNAIVPTTRYADSYDDSGNWVSDHPTVDNIWIPSVSEISTSGSEKGQYYTAWAAIESDRKITLGYGGDYYRWWHRTVSNSGTGYFRGTGAGGGSTPGTGAAATAMGGIVIGFSLAAVHIEDDMDMSMGEAFLLHRLFPMPAVHALTGKWHWSE